MALRPTGDGILRAGDFGPVTCAAMQRSLHAQGASLSVDGAMGRLTNTALQKYLMVTADGIVGPVTVKALEKHVGMTQDGDWGPATTKALRTKLDAGGF